jgi:hypothetical protein
MKLASFERPDEGDYRDLAVAIAKTLEISLLIASSRCTRLLSTLLLRPLAAFV